MDIKKSTSIINRFFILILVMLFGIQCLEGGDGWSQASDDASFDNLFKMAITNEGESYLKVKEKIVAMGDVAIPLIEQKQKSTQWQTKMLSDILKQSISKPKIEQELSQKFQTFLARLYLWQNHYPPLAINEPVEGFEEQKCIPFLVERLWKDFPSSGFKSVFEPQLIYSPDGKALNDPVHINSPESSLIRYAATAALGAISDEKHAPLFLFALRRESHPKVTRILSQTIVQVGTENTLEMLREEYDVEQTQEVKEKIKITIGWLEAKLKKK